MEQIMLLFKLCIEEKPIYIQNYLLEVKEIKWKAVLSIHQSPIQSEQWPPIFYSLSKHMFVVHTYRA